MKKYKVTAVSYLNTKPFLYGIFQSPVQEQIEMSLNIPSVCAAQLESGEVDLGLIPVAAIPDLSNPHIISDYCIGAVGAVKTVCLFSNTPIQDVKKVYLDYHSKTSVALTKILLKKYWKLDPILTPSTEGYLDNVEDETAYLAIGDKTMGLASRFQYVYDLGEIWQDWTGLPFVFAAWVSNKKLPDDFIQDFNKALKAGLEHIQELIYILPTQYFEFDLKEYFTKNISYTLDDAKRKGLERFLKEIKEGVLA
jgi:chorismate dehydratase